MRKIYIPLIAAFILTSCYTQVNYVGSSYPSTSKVDVFISQASVKKPYEVIGKGYVQYDKGSAEIIQMRAVEKARYHGAHGVIIEDYFVVDNTTSISVKSDSSSVVNRKNAVINPTVASGFNILFIRYTE